MKTLLLQGIFLQILCTVCTGISMTACAQTTPSKPTQSKNIPVKTEIQKTDEEWRKLLTPVQFDVLRNQATERPFSGKYDDFFNEGTYYCAACGALLFTSSTKYNSGCGWPAFYDAATATNIVERTDKSHGMTRTEVLCARCGGHLGHVFEDGPAPTGLRYCINSEALIFKPKGEKAPELVK